MRTQTGNAEFISTLTEPRPERAAAALALTSRRTRILALRGLKLCFCTERSLPLEAAAATAFWESRQNGICFYTDKCAAPITSWGTSSYLKVKLQSTVTCSLLPLSVFGIFPLVITKPLN